MREKYGYTAEELAAIPWAETGTDMDLVHTHKDFSKFWDEDDDDYNDGIPDSKDNDHANYIDNDDDGDGIPKEADSDGDGIPDSRDFDDDDYLL